MTKTFFLSLTLLVPLLHPRLASGDDVAELRARVLEMQLENERLRVQLDEQARLIHELSSRVESLANGDGATEPLPAQEETAEAGLPEQGSPTPQLFLRGFADTTAFVQSEKKGVMDGETAFALNELDLLLTSQIASELSVLSEIVFHFQEVEDDAFFEVERIYLKYSPSSLFNLKVGRMHTAIGYWNQTFHHGSWFQTTVTRPEIFLFEDDGGLLPVHSVGLEAFGTKSFSGLDLDYSAAVFNGRGDSLRAVQNVSDKNRSKGINLRLTASPSSIPGLELGFTTYLDQFPAAEDGLRAPTDERILAGHLVHTSKRTEFLAELVRIRHREITEPRTYDSEGLYVQAAYQLARWKPYYRFDLIDVDEHDPVFTPTQQDMNRHTLGTRWDVSTWLALKFEYSYEERPPLFHFQSATLQAAFSF